MVCYKAQLTDIAQQLRKRVRDLQRKPVLTGVPGLLWFENGLAVIISEQGKPLSSLAIHPFHVISSSCTLSSCHNALHCGRRQPGEDFVMLSGL